MHGSSTSAKRRARKPAEREIEPPAAARVGRKRKSARSRASKSGAVQQAAPKPAPVARSSAKSKLAGKGMPEGSLATDPVREGSSVRLVVPAPAAKARGGLARNLHSSPPPPPVLREWLETKRSMHEYLVQRVELEHVERAARLLLAGDSGREPDPIVVDAVAAILERIAEHACALEFGPSGDQRVAAAEALEEVQALLVKLAEPRRADFVALLVDYAARLRRLGAAHNEEDAHAIAQAFVIASTRLDRAFRRLDAAYVREQLARVPTARAKSAPGALAAVAGAMSAKVGAFSDRNAKRAASAFEKARQRRARADQG